jgi:hypothetical protein
MGRAEYSQSSQLSTLVGKPVSRYTKLPKNTDTLRKLTDVKVKPNNRFHYSIYPSVETEYQASYSQLTNLDFYSPVITILGGNPYGHLINTPFTDPGVTIDETSTLVSNVSTVNTNVFGTFNITYVATDGINPDTTKVRIVKVGEYPVVTIEGDNPYTLERYDPYDDEGVTYDANSSVTSTTSSVNNTAVGTYTVNYGVSNQVFTTFHTRIVNVVDTTPPVVTILGDNPYTLERFDVYTDPGATGDLGTIVTPDFSNVQNTSIGSFTVVYNATDGNTLHDVAVTRTVNVVDTVPPVITVLGDDPFTLERFDVYTDPGATVDRGTILTTDLTAVDNTLPHGSSFVVTYTGSDGNTAHDVVATRTVNVVDTVPPVITLLGDNPYEMQPGIDFRDVDPLYEVDLGTSVSIDYSNVVTTDNSTFFVVYRASDGVNEDAVVLRRVAVADTLSPIVTIIGDNPYTLERYAEYVDPGATTDTESGSRFVSITSNVDNTAVGSYTVTYDATDDINANTIVHRIVNVVDTTAPIVTLNGASSVTLERYGIFSDIDEGVEIEAPGSLVSVDTSQLDNTTQGTYTVTYNVVDDQNNANVITREVVVQDTVPPVVSLVDPNTTYVLERYGVWADIDPGVELDDGSYVYQVNLDNTSTGLQSVEYIVIDGTNETTVYRTIRVVDTTPPVITVNEPEYVHEIYTQYTDPGATADAGSILTVDTSNADVSNTANIGTFDIVYSATDGNTAHDVTVIRTVTVVDTTLPVATLKSDPYTTERLGTYSDPGLNLDAGSFIANIDLSNVDTSIAHGSTFDVVYDVSDSNVSHNVYVTRRVTVTDTIDPQLVGLVGYDPHYITIGTDYEENGILLDEGSSYTESNNLGQSLGNYVVTYSATDDAGNSNTFSRDLVVVPEIYSNVIGNLTASSISGRAIIASKSKTASHKFVWGRNGNGIFCNFDPVSGTVSREAGFSNASADDYRKGAMRSDGNLYAVGQGRNVLIFKYENSSWSSSQTIGTGDVYSLDMTPNGNLLVVGAAYFSQGNLFVYQYINGSYVLQKNLTFTEPGRYNGYYIKVSGFGDRIFVVDAPQGFDVSYKVRIYNYAFGNLSLETTITLPEGWLTRSALQVSEDGLTMAVDMVTSQRILIYKYVSGTWSLSHTIQHNQFQQDAILMTYDASYILLVPCGFVYKKVEDSTYKFIYNLPNDMSAISYTGDFIYNSTLSSSSQVDVLKKEITQLPVEMNGRIQTNILKDSVYTDEGVIVRSDYSLESTVSTVNNTEFGTYTVTYTASENSNVATAVRKVTVSPLEFNNLNYILERFESYVEQGATLLPGYELTIDTSNVTTSNTTNVGTFDIVYTATNDTTGHEHVAIRQISVEDTTGPVITLTDGDVGTSDYTVERATTYNDPGATADGGETVTVDTSQLNMDTIGTYTVTYYATDDNGNQSQVTRTVTVLDTTAPVITLIGANPLIVTRETTYNDPGATADGGETVTVDTSQLNMNVFGTYTVTYSATDVYGNIGTATRSVVVKSWEQQARLVSSELVSLESFGSSVSLASDGNTAIVGVLNYGGFYGNGHPEEYAGGTYIFTRSGTSWSNQALIRVPEPEREANDRFGHSVSISSDGNTAIIGAYGEDASVNFGGTGAAYIFTWNGTSWSQQARIQASDKAEGNWFGYSVSISSNGNTAVVAAPDFGGAYIKRPRFGAVYIFTRSGTSWSQQAKIEAPEDEEVEDFGWDAAISGDGNTVIMGVRIFRRAYIFTWNGTSWSQQAKIGRLVEDDYINFNSFGVSASLSSDGNTAIVGANRDYFYNVGDQTGAAYIFTRSGTSWSQQAKIGWSSSTNSSFGGDVSISGDGNTVVAGAAGEGSGGVAYIFTRSGTSWLLQKRILPTGYAGDVEGFGGVIAISGDGNTIIGGTPSGGVYDSAGSIRPGAGAAFVFNFG